MATEIGYNGAAGLSRKARLLTMANWYEATDLLRTLYELRTYNHNIQANRDTMISKLNTCRLSACPYGPKKRFPEKQDFICESFGAWNKLFAQLRAGLYYKDRDANVDKPVPGNSGAVGKPGNENQQNQNDAVTAVSNVLVAMIERINNGEDMVDQYYFERQMKQVWYDKKGEGPIARVEPYVDPDDEVLPA